MLGKRTLVETSPEKNVPRLEAQSFKQRWLGGLCFSLRLFLGVSIAVLLFNVISLAVLVCRFGTKNGYGTVSEGDCSRTRSLNTWLHLLINVLSTGLLVSSDGFLKAASSPSRAEIDKAHADKQWLSVGLLSPRNLRLSWKKTAVCSLLAISSIPLHLLYNSVVFTSLTANEYYWAVVSPSFIDGAVFNLTTSPEFNNSASFYGNDVNNFIEEVLYTNETYNVEAAAEWQRAYEEMQKESKQYERLDRKQCIDAYSNHVLTDRRNVVLVSSAQPSDAILAFDLAALYGVGNIDQISWLCSSYELDGDSCDPTPYQADPDTWEPFGYAIDYCLSEQTSEQCGEKFSQIVAICTVVCNALKILAMCYIYMAIDFDSTIACDGDALASFLRVEDVCTEAFAGIDRQGLDHRWPETSQRTLCKAPNRRALAFAVSKQRWLFATFTTLTLVAVVVALLVWIFSAVERYGYSTAFPSLWDIGFGEGRLNPHLVAFTHQDKQYTPTQLALVANTPQLVLGYMYFVYNGILAAMFARADFCTFALNPTTLMVSSPKGAQRGTWLLGQSLCWGVSLLALQTLLHWLLSQSFFVFQITDLAPSGRPDLEDNRAGADGIINNCAYSPVAIILSLITIGVMLLLISGISMYRVKRGSPPVMTNCSAALSAACHPPAHLKSMEFRNLMWHSFHRDGDEVDSTSLLAVDCNAQIMFDESETIKVVRTRRWINGELDDRPRRTWRRLFMKPELPNMTSSR